jgi:restriction system protein
MGQAIAEASHDDLLAAWLWNEEAWYVREIWKHLKKNVNSIDEHLKRVKEVQLSGWPASPAHIARRYNSVTQALIFNLQKELVAAKDAQDKSVEVWLEMSKELGTCITDVHHRENAGPARIEGVWPLYKQLPRSQRRVSEFLDQYKVDTKGIADSEEACLRYAKSGTSITLNRISSFDCNEFENLIAWLMQRDGYTLLQVRGGAGDLGADVIAAAPDGKKIVLQCKHSRSESYSVGTPALQRFNGTARPVHNADVAIVVTNAKFSKPGRHFADSQGIILLASGEVERWATWGESLADMVSL